MSQTAVDQARARAREYFRTRGTDAPVAAIRAGIAEAFATLDAVIAPLGPAEAARGSIPGEWSVQEIVDHLVETHRPGLDELWCLLAGRRPPDPPIPAGLQSKAPGARPWAWLRDELRRVHGGILDTLAASPDGFVTDARAPLVMVVNVKADDGATVPVEWIEELDWKAYAVTWRLHALDHLKQARKVLAAARGPA